MFQGCPNMLTVHHTHFSLVLTFPQALVDGKNFRAAILDFEFALEQLPPEAAVDRARLLAGGLRARWHGPPASCCTVAAPTQTSLLTCRPGAGI